MEVRDGRERQIRIQKKYLGSKLFQCIQRISSLKSLLNQHLSQIASSYNKIEAKICHKIQIISLEIGWSFDYQITLNQILFSTRKLSLFDALNLKGWGGGVRSNEDIRGLKNIYYIMPDECFPQITFIFEKKVKHEPKFGKFTKETSGHFKEASDYPTILHKSSTELLIS